MDLSKDEALTIFRSWKDAPDNAKPVLEVVFQISALAWVHFCCEGIDVFDDKLRLWFGRVAWGGGNVELPLNDNTRITELKPSDKPFLAQEPKDESVARWIQFKFSNSQTTEGCMITEYKLGHGFWITGLAPLDITITNQTKDET